jgi:hypothetical protein
LTRVEDELRRLRGEASSLVGHGAPASPFLGSAGDEAPRSQPPPAATVTGAAALGVSEPGSEAEWLQRIAELKDKPASNVSCHESLY